MIRRVLVLEQRPPSSRNNVFSTFVLFPRMRGEKNALLEKKAIVDRPRGRKIEEKGRVSRSEYLNNE